MKLQFRIMKSWLCVLMALSSAQLMVGVAATWGATPEPPASVPAPPGGIVVTPGNGKIVLTWKSANGATSYHLKRATTSGGPYTTIASPTCLCSTSLGLTNGTTYYFVVSAVNSAGESANSAQVSATPTGAAEPAVPSGLKTMAGNGQAVLVWKASSGATSYHLKRSTTSGGPYLTIASPTCLCATSLGLTNGTTYYFVVSAVNSAGESANSAQVSAKPTAPAKPGAPSGVKALGEDGRVVLVWKASSGATSYHLKRSTTSGGPYTTIASPTCLCSTSLGLANGTTYYFVVSAVNSAGESANSAQVSATPTGAAEPAVPSGLKTMAGNGQAVLVWKASSGATSYHLKRSTTSGGPYLTISSPTCLCATSLGLTNGTTYYFAVSAVNAAGESANSAQVSATPEAPASSTVTSVTVSPDTASSITAGTLPFTATVQGTTTNKSVTWKVVLGHINASGLYTAPSKAGTDTVTAVSNADPTKSDSTVVKVTTAAPPPTHSVVLSWDASTSTVAGYNVYRSTVSGSGFTKLNLSLITTLTYTDTTVQNGTTYFYVAMAVDSSGNESVDSTQASATIP